MLSSVYGCNGELSIKFNNSKIAKKILPPLEFPHKSIFLLEIEYEERKHKFIATASMIYKNIAITAAHNLWHKRKKNKKFLKAKKILCRIPTKKGEEQGFLDFYPTAYALPKGYLGDDKSDYGILYFSESIGEKFGWIAPKPYQNEKNGYLSGYPRILFHNTEFEIINCNYDQYEDDGQIIEHSKSPKLLKHNIYTFKGCSGAPLRIKINDTWKFIGIHVARIENTNISVKVNEALLENLNNMYKGIKKLVGASTQFKETEHFRFVLLKK